MVSTFRWISNLLIVLAVIWFGIVLFNFTFVREVTADQAVHLIDLHSFLVKTGMVSLLLAGVFRLLAKDMAEKSRIRRISTVASQEAPENRRRLKEALNQIEVGDLPGFLAK